MATITSSKDKTFLGVIAMNLGLEEVGSQLMTSSGATQVPVVLERKLEDALKGKSSKVSVTEAREAMAVLRRAGA